ncbi:ATP-binding cassette domain-containing protein [Curtobacterium sp. MCLR17_042]|uniref:ATP-binding cassette domain-containing protein n=1 Tax=Curtobacterium sp. MCLR17_042 TaxID=2175626 RepID=UPI0015E8AC54|nr:hypothetical protein [Curtobacterium sp. MCLR17_042]
MTVTLTISQVGEAAHRFPWELVLTLSLGFAAETIGFWVKERHELLLTAQVRQLIFRRFMLLSSKATENRSSLREQVLTYPTQISQFAYVVDFAVSSVQIVAVLIVTITLYGAGGVVAVVLIAFLVFASVRLIARVGALWEKYIALEGRRRERIRVLCTSLPRGRFAPGWPQAVNEVLEVRNDEQTLLRKRVCLQLGTGFLDKGALTVVLVIAALIANAIDPSAGFGIGLIVAARYFYSAVQNNLVNYRVVRLAIPMLRTLDESTSHVGDEGAAYPKINGSAVFVQRDTEEGQHLLAISGQNGVSFIPRNPTFAPQVLAAWERTASHHARSTFAGRSEELGLSDATQARFFSDPASLSSGERHRAAVALGIADEPDLLILDDTFASLDGKNRSRMLNVLNASDIPFAVVFSSEDYLPDQRARADHTEQVSERLAVPDAEVEATSGALPDPPARGGTIAAIRIVFGAGIAWILLGAALIAASEVTFAAAVGAGQRAADLHVPVILSCGLGMLTGCVLYFNTLYAVPIRRLTRLHDMLIERLPAFASKRTAGPIVGRLGEDFSELQMSVPGALGAAALVGMQATVTIGLAVAGAPLMLLVVIVVAPLAYVAFSRGSAMISPAATAVANERGNFIGLVGALVESGVARNGRLLGVAAKVGYEQAEASYMATNVAIARAYAFRTGLVGAIVLTTNIAATVIACTPGLTSQLVSPAAIVFFAISLSAGVQSTIEAFHGVGVVSLTAGRVQTLLTASPAVGGFRPAAPAASELLDALDEEVTIIGLVGPSGSGKSLTLDAVAEARRNRSVLTVIEASDPFAEQQTEPAGAIQQRTLAGIDDHRLSGLVLLDESFNALDRVAERNALAQLKDGLARHGGQGVAVVHSDRNLDLFDRVVSVDTHA